jgi:hypothetical protein
MFSDVHSSLDDRLSTHSDAGPKQQILLQGNDNSNTYNILSKNVEIVPSKNSSELRINASNKVNFQICIL